MPENDQPDEGVPGGDDWPHSWLLERSRQPVVAVWRDEHQRLHVQWLDEE